MMMVTEKFTVTNNELLAISNDFAAQMQCAIAGTHSCFKMLRSYLPCATGAERGKYFTLDFGGTNVRVLLVELSTKGKVQILKSASSKIPLELIGSRANAKQLFAFIASVVAKIVDDKDVYTLAHTFSFPVQQIDANRGVLVGWVKEFATAGVVGQDINALLEQALSDIGLRNVRPVVLLNDTVATLLAASYRDHHTIIGSICGTGHNTAFLDEHYNMIINLESGNFDRLPYNEYDLELDANSNNQGQQRLEKMAAGRYLGEIFRLAVARADFPVPYMLDSTMLSAIIMGEDVRFTDAERQLARAIVQRAAALVAASYVGIITYLDMEPCQQINIAIDGALYEKMPLYAATIRSKLDELLETRGEYVHVFAEHGGSNTGAAVAAALVSSTSVN